MTPLRFSSVNSIWLGGSLLIAGCIALPIAVVLITLVDPSSDVWSHLKHTVLAEYLTTTTTLILLVGFAASLLGVSLAWLCTMTDFPGRAFFSWALVLPLAIPAYVVAYVFTDSLEFAGPIQTNLRLLTGWQFGDYYFPQIRSVGGAAMVLTLALYPYVYLFARSAFLQQSATYFEAARVLGASSFVAFWRIALPSARPAIAGGVALVLMETIADYGVADYFGITTFTTGIFRTWYGLGDKHGAMQLAAYLFTFALALVLLELLARRGRVSNPARNSQPVNRMSLPLGRQWVACLSCALVFTAAFAYPIATLAFYAVTEGDPRIGHSFSGYIANSFTVGSISAVVALALALWLVYAERLNDHWLTKTLTRIASLGYALPGAVLGLGLLIPLTNLDRSLAHFLKTHFNLETGLLLTGSITALVLVYVARFLTVAYNACHGGMAKIHLHLDDAARSLGATPWRVLREVHIPLLRPAVFSALILVFIDVLKELPATLILRPFNFETLATRAYRLAADERLAEASTAALMIVVLSLIPVVVLGLRLGKERQG
ncbi:MAG: iron ABC transporter permease [Pseudomonadota bacterium]